MGPQEMISVSCFINVAYRFYSSLFHFLFLPLLQLLSCHLNFVKGNCILHQKSIF